MRFLIRLGFLPSLLVFSIACGNLSALTLSDIRTEIRKTIKDNPTDTSFRRYSDAFLLPLINETQREIVNFTFLADRTSSYVLSPLTTYYNLPTDLMTVHQLYFTNTSGQLIELKEEAQRSLYDNNPQWESQSGSPSSYLITGATSSAGNASAPLLISYIPIPTQTSTGTVRIWYYNIVPDLSSDSDVPFENRRDLYPYHFSLVYGVTAKIKILEGWMDEATVYQSFYKSSVDLMKSNLGRAPNRNASFSLPSLR